MRKKPPDNKAGEALYLWVKDFYERRGRVPRLAEIPATEVQVNYHFGSYVNLKAVVQDGFQPVRRRELGRRYCRFCGKLLPAHRWFFCDPPEKMNGDPSEDLRRLSCQEKYLDRGDPDLGDERDELAPDKEERKPLSICQGCLEKCKVTIPKEQDESKLTFSLTCALGTRWQDGSQN